MESGLSLFAKHSSIDVKEEYIAHLENILFLMPVHVYWIDRQNVYLGCNDLQAKSFGLSSHKEVVGKTNYDLLPNKEEAEQVNAINLKIMQSGIARTIEEKVVLAGKERVYLSEKVPLRNQEGAIIGLLGVSFDITHRKQMELALKEAKNKAEIANQIKNEFIANMEHDIRTPVSGIIGINNHLKSLETDPRKKRMLEDVETSALELMKYFTEVLEFTYIEAGEIPVLSKKFDLKALVENIWNMELPAAKNKGLELIVDFSEEMPAMLLGDKFRIQRILINLISNAIKFTETGYVKVIVQLAKKINKKNVIVAIIVEDTGIGIPEFQQNILFEKFNKGEASNKGTYKGIGLGLRIVKKLIQELNGEIEVTSQLNAGTKFACILPFKLPLLLDTDL